MKITRRQLNSLISESLLLESKYDQLMTALPELFLIVSFEQSNYWVLAYDNEDGYALIAGGQTNVPTLDGLCSYGNPTSGLWIF